MQCPLALPLAGTRGGLAVRLATAANGSTRRARATRRFDACVIGSGAAGAVVTSELVDAGWDVVLVEQGEHVAPKTFLHDLIPSFETARARDIDGRWVDSGYPWTACCVGGGTRFYAGVSLRLRHVDLDASAHVVDDALPPAWPYGYAELRPHYEWVEGQIGVTSDAGLDPFRPSPGIGVLPAHEMSPRGGVLAKAASAHGLHPFPVPLAVASRPFGTRPQCAELTNCTDYACPIGAKGDVYERLLAPRLGNPNLTLRTGLKAMRLVEDRRGHVAVLECRSTTSSASERIRARTFIVAANAVQTSALLLRSTSATSPRGLGNERDLVGRGLCMKVGQNLTGWLDAPIDGVPAVGGRWVTLGISDFYVDDSCPTGLGGLIFETGPAANLASDATALRVECLLADQPLASNRVTVDGTTVTMDYRPHPIDLQRLAFVRDRATELLREAGAREVVAETLDFTLGSSHFHGTCRMGTDPRTSVCDPEGRVRGSDNLLVADGGLMPYPGAVNPTLTIQAVAHRVACRLVTDEQAT